MTKTKKIPTPINFEAVREELNTSIQACLVDPRYNDVVAHIQAHDEAIEAGTEGKPLGWVLDALQTPSESVIRSKRMIETACRVFHGILQSLETESEKAAIQPQIALTVEVAQELEQWAANGWEAYMQGFQREIRGMSADYVIERLGVPADQVTVSEGLATVSLSDTIEKVLTDPKVVEHKGFRRFCLSTFAAFYRYAFGQTGSSDRELLESARVIDVSLYGEAKVAEREAERAKPTAAQQSPTSSSGTGRKSDTKRRAQERGREEYKTRMDAPERKRGYEQVGGKKGK